MLISPKIDPHFKKTGFLEKFFQKFFTLKYFTYICAMKLIITDYGDPSVGIFSQEWEIDCPFHESDIDNEGLEWFKRDIINIYKDYCEGSIQAYYKQ